MLFPIGDDNSKRTIVPWVTWGLIAVNVLVFLLQVSWGDRFTYGYSMIPAEIVTGRDMVHPVVYSLGGHATVIPQAPGPYPIYLTLLTSMFMHGGLMHLGGNMLY